MNIIKDRQGKWVDAGGLVWLLNTPSGPQKIDWSLVKLPGSIFEAAVDYSRVLVQNCSHHTVVNFYWAARRLGRHPECILNAGGILEAQFFISGARGTMGASDLQALRSFYGWAVENAKKGFSESVVRQIHKVKMPTPPDRISYPGGTPDGRPLDASERICVLEDLHSAPGSCLTRSQRTAVLLCATFGCNSFQWTLIRDADCVPASAGTPALIHLQRHKKSDTWRGQAKVRQIEEPAIAVAVEGLLADNRARAARMRWPAGLVGVPAGVAIPLFMRASPIEAYADPQSDMHEFALHMSPRHFRNLVRQAVCVLFAEFGSFPPRRWRRTLATVLLNAGHPPEAIAEMFDHQSGTSYVTGTYASGGPRVVEHLDRVASSGPYAEMIEGLSCIRSMLT